MDEWKEIKIDMIAVVKIKPVDILYINLYLYLDGWMDKYVNSMDELIVE